MTTVNNFIDKISNEQTALLPAIEFRGDPPLSSTSATSPRLASASPESR